MVLLYKQIVDRHWFTFLLFFYGMKGHFSWGEVLKSYRKPWQKQDWHCSIYQGHAYKLLKEIAIGIVSCKSSNIYLYKENEGHK